MKWPKKIWICPHCDRVQPPGRMGCCGAHEDAHRYTGTVCVEVVEASEYDHLKREHHYLVTGEELPR